MGFVYVSYVAQTHTSKSVILCEHGEGATDADS
jgi:hypothetical protein